MPVATPQRRVHVKHVMGTVASLDMRGGRTDGLDAAIRSLHDPDSRCSTYRADSEISRLDRGSLPLTDASPDVRAVLERCEQLRVQTDGYFDARGSGRL